MINYSLIGLIVAVTVFGFVLLSSLDSALIYREKITQEVSDFKEEFNKFKSQIKAIVNR